MKKRNYLHLYKSFFQKRIVMTVLLGIVMVFTASAQNNAYNIADELYKIYQQAYTNRKTSRGLQLADSLYHRAEVMGDKKAQCIALSVKLLHYNNYYDSQNKLFFQSIKELQDKALQTGYIQYYYWATNYYTNYLIARKSFPEVLSYIKSVQEFAKKNNHIYGIYSSYQNLGLVNFQHGGTFQAIKNYQDAINFGTKFLPDQEMTVNHRRISECYRLLGEYDKMYDELLKGSETAKTLQTRKNLIPQKCFAWFALGKDKDFLENYQEAFKLLNIDEQDSVRVNKNQLTLELKIFKLTLDKNYEQAKYLISKISPFAEQCRIQVIFYNRIGNLKKAIEWQHKLIKNNYKFLEGMYNDDINSIYAQINNLRLLNEKKQTDIKNTRLDLVNSQLSLKNSSLELQQVHENEYLNALKASNLQLSLNNKKLETKQLRETLERQKLQHETIERKLEVKNRIFISLLAVAGFIILISLIYIYITRRYKKKLDHSNYQLRKNINELFITKDHALQAEKMKTMFIQNMSHEIRTPLNAIVGFSQILVEMGEGLNNEEKKEMSNSIMHNSELLTSLINDILDITTLESGKYVMNIQPVHVAQICRQVMETTAHRKAPNVELKLDIQVAESYQINTDAIRVKQVLINLVTNAEKNTSTGSIVLTCSLHENPGMLTFSVTDTGTGIPKEKMSKIFERFQKLDQKKQGFGLGLNICQMIAQKLEGKIYIDENYTNGARFLFAIPINTEIENK